MSLNFLHPIFFSWAISLVSRAVFYPRAIVWAHTLQESVKTVHQHSPPPLFSLLFSSQFCVVKSEHEDKGFFTSAHVGSSVAGKHV